MPNLGFQEKLVQVERANFLVNPQDWEYGADVMCRLRSENKFGWSDWVTTYTSFELTSVEDCTAEK